MIETPFAAQYSSTTLSTATTINPAKPNAMICLKSLQFETTPLLQFTAAMLTRFVAGRGLLAAMETGQRRGVFATIF